MLLTIGKRFKAEVESLQQASLIYRQQRDLSGEGGSTFPNGKLTGGLTVSYNGRIWKGQNAKKNILGELLYCPRAEK
jgi:hypothetical protein